MAQLATAKPEEQWHEARLIPTSGIGGQEDQEQRATSVLLAVLHGVPEFGRAVLAQAGAPAGHIRSFIEVRFPDETGKIPRPDGAVIVERGRTRWVALLEVKTGGAPLRTEQVNAYLDVAHAEGYDAVITISNQITGSPDEVPIKAKKYKTVALRHLSWWGILTEARLEQADHVIASPDQAWILDELIAYLRSGRAGTGGLDDMGASWVAVRDAARQKTLRLTTKGLDDVVSRWDQLVHFLALELAQDLGHRVVPVWPKESTAPGRLDRHARSLVDTGQLHAALRVPDAVGPLELRADLWTRQLTTSVLLDAPQTGKPKTRISWLIRQLNESEEPIRVEVHYPNARDPVGGWLSDARAKPDRLLMPSDPHREPRSFRLALARDLGLKRGTGTGSLIAATEDQTVDFYRTVVQRLRPWHAPAPTLPPPVPETESVEAGDMEGNENAVVDHQASLATDGAAASG